MANDSKRTEKATEDLLQTKKWDFCNGQVCHLISTQYRAFQLLQIERPKNKQHLRAAAGKKFQEGNSIW